MLVSIIVPTLNEDLLFLEFFNTLQHQSPPWELIQVDGGSSSPPPTLLSPAFPNTLKHLSCEPGRARQMNRGAQEASGDIYLFLHVDLKLPPNGLDHLRKAILEGYEAGGFFKKFQPTNFWLRLNQFLLNRIRTFCLRSFVGTNGMFCTRELFQKIQGFPEWPFLEDVEFSDRFKRSKARLKIIREPLLVSPRKYLKEGTFRRALKNIFILILYRGFHFKPESLLSYYVSSNKKKTPP